MRNNAEDVPLVVKYVRLFLCIIILMISTASAAAGQENGLCPKIEVFGPAGVTNQGEKMRFVARLSRADSAYRYEWKVSPTGRIAEGQGTPAVIVIATYSNANVIATLTVGGLPAGCDNVAEDMGYIAQTLPVESVDEWGKVSRNDELGKLDAFFAVVSHNPGFKGVLVLRGIPANKQNAKNSRLKFIVGHAKFRKFDPELLYFVFSDEPARAQRVVTVHLSGDPAQYPCSDCVRVKGNEVKQ